MAASLERAAFLALPLLLMLAFSGDFTVVRADTFIMEDAHAAMRKARPAFEVRIQWWLGHTQRIKVMW